MEQEVFQHSTKDEASFLSLDLSFEGVDLCLLMRLSPFLCELYKRRWLFALSPAKVLFVNPVGFSRLMNPGMTLRTKPRLNG